MVLNNTIQQKYSLMAIQDLGANLETTPRIFRLSILERSKSLVLGYYK